MNSGHYIVIFFAIGYLGFMLTTRRGGDFASFSTGNKMISGRLTFASLAATFVGPAMTMGLTRAGYTVGFLYLPFAILSALNFYLVSRFISSQLRRKFANAYSLGDVVGGPDSHNHRNVRLFIGCIGFSLTVAISIVMSKAGGELLNHLFGLPLPIAIVLVSAIVTTYSCFGGIRATIQTDAFQFICFVILIPLLAVWLLLSDSFTFEAFKASGFASTKTAWESLTPAAIISMIVFWFLGSGFDPTYIQRTLSTKSPETSRRAMRSNAVFVLIWMSFMYIVGVIGFSIDPNLPATDQVLLILANSHFSDALFGIFIVPMIGVVMSSQDSMLNGAAILLSNDIAGTIKPSMDSDEKLRIAKIATIFVGICSAAVAIYVDSILKAVILIWSVYTPAVVPTIVASIYLRKPYWQSAMASIVAGLATSASIVLGGLTLKIPAVLAGLIVGVLAYYFTHLILQRRNTSAAIAQAS